MIESGWVAFTISDYWARHSRWLTVVSRMQPEHCRERGGLPPGRPTMRPMTGFRNGIIRQPRISRTSVPASRRAGDNRGGPQAGPHATVAMEE